MIFKKGIYYYVPRCPNCGSRVTGRYMKEQRNADDTIYVMKNSLKHGELITFVPNVPYENCYCEDCGHEWHHNVDLKWISKERIEEEKKARDTLKRYLEFEKKYPKKKKSIFKKIFGLLPW